MTSTGQKARGIVAAREADASAISGIHVLRRPHSFHHRQSRRLGDDTPANLVLIDGTGTIGEHAWVHRHPAVSRILGLIVPAWHDDPATWPIYRRDPYGVGWDWFTQTRTGDLEWVHDAIGTVARANSITPGDVHTAIDAFRDLVSQTRGGL